MPRLTSLALVISKGNLKRAARMRADTRFHVADVTVAHLYQVASAGRWRAGYRCDDGHVRGSRLKKPSCSVFPDQCTRSTLRPSSSPPSACARDCLPANARIIDSGDPGLRTLLALLMPNQDCGRSVGSQASRTRGRSGGKYDRRDPPAVGGGVQEASFQLHCSSICRQ